MQRALLLVSLLRVLLRVLDTREKDGFTQVWKAEEGDLDSPKLQKQRAQLPQLQKDPLQLQLNMDALIVEVKADTPLLEVCVKGVVE